jgi:hypothetical protein
MLASCLWTPVSGVGMYAWFGLEAKSTVNRRDRTYSGCIDIASAQTV